MSDLDTILRRTERSLGRRQIQAGHALMVVMARDIGHPIGEVWSALAEPDRVAEWLAQPEGDLRRGGNYSLPDGSHGDILRCDPPRLLTVSWIREGAAPAELELHLTAEDSQTRIELLYASVRKGFATTAAPGGGIWTGGAGWEFFLDMLEEYLGGTIPQKPPGLMPDLKIEGELVDLFDARNESWRRAADEFEAERAP
ncbi:MULTISPECIES: SRPBCC domain-containing protein [unclassified Arthrobacter]|uniref:SRPBCC domain-containing protein n=1 Tax=unclassified Arthrobacter TaxID=235627 RepID=UPI001D14682A|nr:MULTISPECIES: SRPBCC domain-containing protein [unclassified Arthrobacter]MCC3275127.1 SRPBCC domain-containing protein [Arthrobacter sp. zg-Y20]MCC3278206.1 SRPBCC domain-containing protein [Arthrobacter sp. zg-Y40]MCC9176576.1 SRPBCC domain-containing protein [Arthrobacter sp. zg-Y750]MDK1315284.1 SRPBCC domain-containing protein [Arthrobacter sp. zg.Y20]MDK1326722.1 SRPBCC domain-containing protein [Arthrobacter sp. zg-Y1143]